MLSLDSVFALTQFVPSVFSSNIALICKEASENEMTMQKSQKNYWKFI